jgi:simple sugar transport system permease protein
MNELALLIAATLSAGTVLAIAALGLLVNERAGVVNLGAEGLMLVAAIAGFATAVHTGSDVLGFLAGMAAGALLAALSGLLVIWLGTNQYATGLALSLFGAGFSAFVGTSYTQQRLSERMHFELPGLADLPFVGKALFAHHPLVYGAVLLAVGLHVFLYRTRAGLVLRAVGAEQLPRGTAVRIRVQSLDLLTLDAHASVIEQLQAQAAQAQAPEEEGDDEGAAGPLHLEISVDDATEGAPAA